MKNYDLTRPWKFISYLDMNNLYGWAMSGYLPYGGFKWLKNVDNFDVNSINKNSPIGYILEVDLEYHKELHVLYNDYSLAPEKLAISYDMLSGYYEKIADEYGIKFGYAKKLIPNLGEKTNYVLHYRNLWLYLSLGMKLTKIHRVLKFKQSDWTKKYIDFNTEKRTNPANSFENVFWVDEKFNKNNRKFTKKNQCQISKRWKSFLKHTRRPAHITHKIFDKNYGTIHETEPILTLNKPIYVGFTVLQLSKWLMYDFDYNFIKKSLMLNCCLLTQTVLLMK